MRRHSGARTPPQARPVDEYRGYAAECAASDRCLLLVAAAAGRLVGVLDFTASAQVRTSHTGTFELSIARRWRRRGVGRLLVSELLTSCAASRRIEKVCLSVLSSNEPALALYRSLGFAEEGRRVAGVKLGESRYCDEVWMYRTVNEAIDVR